MKVIKYVIWGAGEYGRRAFWAIGEECVEAFMDSDSRKVGTVYCNKKIINLSQFIKDYSDWILLIANKRYEECAEVLEEYSIYKIPNPSELFSYVGCSELKQNVLSIVNEDILYSIKNLNLYYNYG